MSSWALFMFVNTVNIFYLRSIISFRTLTLELVVDSQSYLETAKDKGSIGRVATI
jgi:hypothetical protein